MEELATLARDACRRFGQSFDARAITAAWLTAAAEQGRG
jgi:hypothetical protein